MSEILSMDEYAYGREEKILAGYTNEEQYREALRETLNQRKDEFFDFLQLTSLRELATWNPQLLEIYLEETAPANLTLEIYLREGNVVGHAAPLVEVAQFIKSLAEVVQKTAKGKYHDRGVPDQLLLEPFFAGSLGIKMSAPNASTDSKNGQEVLFDDPVETSLMLSLRKVADLFTQASKSAGIEAALQFFPTPAKEELRKALQIVKTAGWEIDGRFIQRSRKIESISLTAQGVSRLLEAIGQEDLDSRIVEWTGVLDGYRTSLNCVYLKVAGLVYRLDVSNRYVLLEADRLPAGSRVKVRVQEYETRKGSGKVNRSYSLLSIKVIEE